MLEHDAHHELANEGLEYLLEGQGAFQELSEFLQERAERTDDVDARRRLQQRSAELMDEELGDAGGAISVWRAQYAEVPTENAFGALTKLLRKTLQWDELIELNRQHERTEDEVGVPRLQTESVRILIDELNDGERALDILESALLTSEDVDLVRFSTSLFLDEHRCSSAGLNRARLAKIIESKIAEDDSDTRIAILPKVRHSTKIVSSNCLNIGRLRHCSRVFHETKRHTTYMRDVLVPHFQSKMPMLCATSTTLLSATMVCITERTHW